MKKLLSVLLALVMVLLSVSFSTASAEEWVCPSCGKTNTTNFCTSCGAKHDVWICPNCGAENSDAFCGNCGTEKPAEAQPETPAAAEPAAEGTGSVKAGDIVTFGRYPQTAEGTDETPIEWIVLDVQDGKALVISKYGLDKVPYNSEKGNVTWEVCSLRTWLNNDFLKNAFSPEEQAAIPVTEVDNSAAQGYDKWETDGGNNTQDQVFLLSWAEAFNLYFPEEADRRCVPTDYAIANGASTSILSKGVIAYKIDGRYTCYWLLRSPGGFQSYSTEIGYDGGSYTSPAESGNSTIRPALWIDLESEIFRSENSQYGAAPQAEAEPAGVQAGDIITFGRYPQTVEGTDQTPIEWIVLEVKDGKALVISRYGLDAKPYSNEHRSVTWEHCDLRFWLNGEFWDGAFSSEEQSAIQFTEVDNSAAQGFNSWRTNGGNNTQDPVFLLSYAEAYRYFAVTWENKHNIKARVSPTAYTVNKGVWSSSDYKTENGSVAGWWWLRSPGNYQYNAANVSTNGSITYDDVSRKDGCVRPALWIDLESEIFRSENPQD